MAIGAIEAFKQHKIKPSSLPIIGFDAIQDAKKYVDDGELFATMQQNPEGMGKIAIKIVDDLIEANSVQHDIFIDVLPYKKTR